MKLSIHSFINSSTKHFLKREGFYLLAAEDEDVEEEEVEVAVAGVEMVMRAATGRRRRRGRMAVGGAKRMRSAARR
jgi:hypothetical protein